MDKPIQQEDGLTIVQQIKRQKNPYYPYHIIGDTYTIKEIDYLIIVELGRQIPILTILPYKIQQGLKKKKYVGLQPIVIRLVQLPFKPISVIKVQKLTISEKTSKFQSLDFIIGYRCGYLLTVRYSVKDKQCIIKQYWNYLRQKTSMWSKATNYIFGQEQFYKLWIKKPVRQIQIRQGLFPYIFQIGNAIIFTSKITQQNDSLLQKLYEETQWKNPNLYSLSTQTTVKIAKQQYKALSYKKQLIMISWNKSVSSYSYKDISFNYIKHQSAQIIYIASNGSIFLLDLNSLLILQQISFDIGIRALNIYPLQQIRDVLIVTGELDGIFLIQITKNRYLDRYCRIGGHRAYVMSATIIKNKIVTAGADHKIAMNHYATIKKWYNFQENDIESQNSRKGKKIVEEIQQKVENNQFFDENQNQQKQKIIETEKKGSTGVKMAVKRITRQQPKINKSHHPVTKVNDRGYENTFQDLYSLGIKTDQRTNLYDYGFGSMSRMGKMQCFFNLDGKIKIFDLEGVLN